MSKVGVPIIKVFRKNSDDLDPGIEGIANSDKMWVLNSTHYSILDAKKVVDQLITRFGADHVMVCQVIDHKGDWKVI
jgi:hypothetical protein